MFNQFSSRLISVFALAVAIMALTFTPSMAQKKEAVKPALTAYLVVSPHTAEECLSALDDVAASEKGALDKWYWGCMAGDHNGYEIVQAESEPQALKVVPESIRAKAKVMKLNKFTDEQVASFHKMK